LGALELDHSLSEAHLVGGDISFFVAWDSAKAEREYQRALELDSSNVRAHSLYGFMLACTGRYQEAIAQANKAQQLDPLSPVIEVNRALMYCYAGDYQRALVLGQEALTMAPDFFLAHHAVGLSLFRQGQREAGISELEKAVRLAPVAQERSTLGWMYGRAGRTAEARRLLEEFQAQAKEKYVPNLAFAIIYDGLGDIEQANVWMTKAIEEREARLVFLQATLADEITRANPHYPEWVKKIGLFK
jgi:Flp pilus assembly protein TadD